MGSVRAALPFGAGTRRTRRLASMARSTFAIMSPPSCFGDHLRADTCVQVSPFLCGPGDAAGPGFGGEAVRNQVGEDVGDAVVLAAHDDAAAVAAGRGGRLEADDDAG